LKAFWSLLLSVSNIKTVYRSRAADSIGDWVRGKPEAQGKERGLMVFQNLNR
jgi:hypothetical protein